MSLEVFGLPDHQLERRDVSAAVTALLHDARRGGRVYAEAVEVLLWRQGYEFHAPELCGSSHGTGQLPLEHSGANAKRLPTAPSSRKPNWA